MSPPTATMSSSIRSSRPRKAARAASASAASETNPAVRAANSTGTSTQPRPFSRMPNELNSMVLRHNPLKDLMSFAQTNLRHRAQVHEELRRRAKLQGFKVDARTPMKNLIALNHFIERSGVTFKNYITDKQDWLAVHTLAYYLRVRVSITEDPDQTPPNAISYFLLEFDKDTAQDFIVYACGKEFLPEGLMGILSEDLSSVEKQNIQTQFNLHVLERYQNPPAVVRESPRLAKWIPFVRYIMKNYINQEMHNRKRGRILHQWAVRSYPPPFDQDVTIDKFRADFFIPTPDNCTKLENLTFEDLARVAPSDLEFEWNSQKRSRAL